FGFGPEWRADFDRHGHHLSVPAQKKQLLTVATPARLLASRDRNLPLELAAWKRPHIHLEPPGFVGRVRHPMAIRRELAVHLVEVRMQKGGARPRGCPRARLPLHPSLYRQHPDVPLGLWVILPIYDKPAVPGPLRQVFAASSREQQLILPRPTSLLLVQI